MKRLLLGVGLLGAAAFLCGCPIYSTEQRIPRVPGQRLLQLPATRSYSGSCIDWQCSTDGDCDSGYVCSDHGQCIPGSRAPTPEARLQRHRLLRRVRVQALERRRAVRARSGRVRRGCRDRRADLRGRREHRRRAAPKPTPATARTARLQRRRRLRRAGARCVDGACAQQAGLCSDGTQCMAAGRVVRRGHVRGALQRLQPLPVGLRVRLHPRRLQPQPRRVLRVAGRRAARAARPASRATASRRATRRPRAARPQRRSGLRQRRVHPRPGRHVRLRERRRRGAARQHVRRGLHLPPPRLLPGLRRRRRRRGTSPTAGGDLSCKNVTIETGAYAVCAAPRRRSGATAIPRRARPAPAACASTAAATDHPPSVRSSRRLERRGSPHASSRRQGTRRPVAQPTFTVSSKVPSLQYLSMASRT